MARFGAFCSAVIAVFTLLAIQQGSLHAQEKQTSTTTPASVARTSLSQTFRPNQGPAYYFLKQNEGNPKNECYPHQNCKRQHHTKKFLHHVKIHFKPHLTYLLMSLKTRPELSKVPIGRRRKVST